MPSNQELIDHYQKIHSTRDYGRSSIKYLRFIRPAIKVLAPNSVIDFGCGQSRLIDLLAGNLGFEPHRYDPGIKEISSLPEKKFDLLINIDVLEHIEEKDIDDVLAQMRKLCMEAIIVVDLKEAKLILEDGRNAHVTLKPREWWEKKISNHFGPLYNFKTPRSTRAGFITKKRSTIEEIHFRILRFFETVKYYALRAFGIKEGQ